MSANSKRICESLQGLRVAITRAEIIERTGLDSQQVGGSLHALTKSGAVVKHPGDTKRTSGYTLSPEAAERMEPEPKRAYTKRPATPDRDYALPAPRIGSGNDLAQAHVATTLGLLTQIMEIDVGELRKLALACHREAVELMQRGAT